MILRDFFYENMTLKFEVVSKNTLYYVFYIIYLAPIDQNKLRIGETGVELYTNKPKRLVMVERHTLLPTGFYHVDVV